MSVLRNASKKPLRKARLPTGTKLPPQRDLAFDIGVTIGTVGRAYALVRERGLVSGEVGRGTFVLGSHEPQAIASVADRGIHAGVRAPALPGKLRMDSTSAPAVGQHEIIEKLTHDILRAHPDEVVDYTRVWPGSWQDAGSALAEIGQLDAGARFDRLDDRRACRRARRHRRDDRARRQDRL